MATGHWEGFLSHFPLCEGQEVAICLSDAALSTSGSKIICGKIKGHYNRRVPGQAVIYDCTPNVQISLEIDDALLVDPEAGLKCKDIEGISPDKCFFTALGA